MSLMKEIAKGRTKSRLKSIVSGTDDAVRTSKGRAIAPRPKPHKPWIIERRLAPDVRGFFRAFYEKRVGTGWHAFRKYKNVEEASKVKEKLERESTGLWQYRLQSRQPYHPTKDKVVSLSTKQ